MGNITAGDRGCLIVVRSGTYVMSGSAWLQLQLLQSPRPTHTRLSLTIQASAYTYTDNDGNIVIADPGTAATFVTAGDEFGTPPAGAVYLASLEVDPPGGNKFTSALGTLTVNAVMLP